MKNLILRTITGAAAGAFVFGMCAVESVPLVAAAMIIPSGGWLVMYTHANEERMREQQ